MSCRLSSTGIGKPCLYSGRAGRTLSRLCAPSQDDGAHPAGDSARCGLPSEGILVKSLEAGDWERQLFSIGHYRRKYAVRSDIPIRS